MVEQERPGFAGQIQRELGDLNLGGNCVVGSKIEMVDSSYPTVDASIVDVFKRATALEVKDIDHFSDLGGTDQIPIFGVSGGHEADLR